MHLNNWIVADKHTSMARSIPLKPSVESAVEQMKKESDYFDDFRRGAKRVLWRTITLHLVSSQHC